MKIHIATSREIGQRCINFAKSCIDLELVSMEDCEVFISVLYDKLIDEAFVNSKRACYNFHPGILPRYRGSGAYSWAIINGEEEAGVTLHKIDVSIDHGQILEIWRFPIGPEDTAEDLFRKAEDIIFAGFQKWITEIAQGDLVGTPQDETKARLYYRKELETQRDLTKFVRAFSFKGKPKAFYRKKDGMVVELDYGE